jgi:hypothetical protein
MRAGVVRVISFASTDIAGAARYTKVSKNGMAPRSHIAP